ncbi:MAG: ABC transporter permease subunit [Planctomycetes bacterium]|nr:ABC transporter permease subunit [Planctomycetota bacterium]
MIRRNLPKWLFVSLAIAGVIVVLAVYEWLSVRQTANNPSQTTVPSYSKLIEGIQRAFKMQGPTEAPKPPMFWNDIGATLSRLALGLGLGVIASTIIGILMGCYRWIEAPISPIITFMSKVPPVAIMPFYFLFAGISFRMYVLMVALGIFFSMTQTIFQAVRDNVSDEAISKAYTLGASELEVIYEVIWKQILPNVLDCIRSQTGPAMVYLVLAEYSVGEPGMGSQIRMQYKLLSFDIILFYAFVLGVLGLILDSGLEWFRKWLCPWFREGR